LKSALLAEYSLDIATKQGATHKLGEPFIRNGVKNGFGTECIGRQQTLSLRLIGSLKNSCEIYRKGRGDREAFEVPCLSRS
jgi:hypothetical protein